MEAARVAELQVLLEGVSLPAERASLVSYALDEGASGEQMALLQRLAEREYDTIDDVAEELFQVQPSYEHESDPPREESGPPPGGAAYTQRQPESGHVRDLGAASDG